MNTASTNSLSVPHNPSFSPVPGTLVWTKFGRFPWWPCIVLQGPPQKKQKRNTISIAKEQPPRQNTQVVNVNDTDKNNQKNSDESKHRLHGQINRNDDNHTEHDPSPDHSQKRKCDHLSHLSHSSVPPSEEVKEPIIVRFLGDWKRAKAKKYVEFCPNDTVTYGCPNIPNLDISSNNKLKEKDTLIDWKQAFAQALFVVQQSLDDRVKIFCDLTMVPVFEYDDVSLQRFFNLTQKNLMSQQQQNKSQRISPKTKAAPHKPFVDDTHVILEDKNLKRSCSSDSESTVSRDIVLDFSNIFDPDSVIFPNQDKMLFRKKPQPKSVQKDSKQIPKSQNRKKINAQSTSQQAAEASGNNNDISNTSEKPSDSKDGLFTDDNDFVCCVCETPGDLICCDGDCLQSFHEDCLHDVEIPDDKFLCEECLKNDHKCFYCNRSFGSEKTHKCSNVKCGKFYHTYCIELLSNAKIDPSNPTNFQCPRHICAICGIPCNTCDSTFCTRCPVAYHRNCQPPGLVFRHDFFHTCAKHIIIEFRQKNRRLTRSHLDRCVICHQDGFLYNCDGCPLSYHPQCAVSQGGYFGPCGESVKSWFCSSCSRGHLPLSGDNIWIKYKKFPWWPGRIVPLEELPNFARVNPNNTGFDFPVYFYGSHNYAWVNNTNVTPWDPDLIPLFADNKKLKYLLGLDEINKSDKEVDDSSNENRNPDYKDYISILENIYLLPKNAKTFCVDPPCDCHAENGTFCSDSMCMNRVVHIECNKQVCEAKHFCQNRRFSQKKYAKTKVQKTGTKGYGLFAADNITEGSLVTEYVGEVLDLKLFRQRVKDAKNQGKNMYIARINNNTFIDSTTKGNLGRFINHSCAPNCEAQIWSVDNENRVGIFAKQDISKDSELTVDYMENVVYVLNPVQCSCNEVNCIRYFSRPKS